jgi:hypothetical protein
MKALPQALKLGVGDTGASPARIDQLALRRVVAEQQRTNPMPAALRKFANSPLEEDGFELVVPEFRETFLLSHKQPV